jgi:hypothetical protein
MAGVCSCRRLSRIPVVSDHGVIEYPVDCREVLRDVGVLAASSPA